MIIFVLISIIGFLVTQLFHFFDKIGPKTTGLEFKDEIEKSHMGNFLYVPIVVTMFKNLLQNFTR